MMQHDAGDHQLPAVASTVMPGSMTSSIHISFFRSNIWGSLREIPCELHKENPLGVSYNSSELLESEFLLSSDV
jgi:hypothetical protein